jgi:hypothetical protein
LIQFESIGNLIQMKLMKVVYNMRNMMIQALQYFVEFQLIKAITIQMRMIQFESIVNLIQMKLIKVRNMMIQEFQDSVEVQLT